MAAPSRLPREAHAVAAQVAVCAAHGGGGGVLIAEQRVFPGDIVIVNGEQGRLVVAQMLTLSSAQVIPSRSSSSHAMCLKP